MNCVLHKNLKLEYFCQTCLDAVCQQCIKSNPHSNEFHRIQKIQTAVQHRRETFKEYVKKQINPLMESIKQKLQSLKYKESQELQCRNVILKDILLEFEAIQHRTKEKTDTKITQQQTQIKYYQAYLNILDDLAYTFEKTSQDPYNFLILYQDFNNQLKDLELKEIKEKIIEFDLKQNHNQNQAYESSNILMIQHPNLALQKMKSLKLLQFPRQIKNAYRQLSKLKELQNRNQFVNSLIGQACQSYKQEEKQIGVKSLQKYKHTLHLFNETNQKILALNSCKSCAFCDLTLQLNTLNDQCPKNTSVKVQFAAKYSNLNITVDFKGTRRHYWVDTPFQNRKIPDINVRTIWKTKIKSFQSSLQDLNIVKCCFKKYQIENVKFNADNKLMQGPSFMTPFQKEDKQQKGVISKISFKYILTKIFMMKENQSQILTELLSHAWLSTEQAQKLKHEKIQSEQKLKKAENIVQKNKIIDNQQKKIPQQIVPIQGVRYTLLKDFISNPLFMHQQYSGIIQEDIKKQEQKNNKSSFAPRSFQMGYKRKIY